MNYFIVHYNTPELTNALVLSIYKQCTKIDNIFIFENSDTRKYNVIDKKYEIIIDNSKNKIINFKKIIEKKVKKHIFNETCLNTSCGTFNHSMSVEWFYKRQAEPFILLDSDVIIKKDLSELSNNSFCFVSDIYYINGSPIRIYPFVSYLNVNILHNNKICFCDGKHIYPNFSLLQYDTGGWFLNQCINKNLQFKKINYTDYVSHFGLGSWKKSNTATLRYKKEYYDVDTFLKNNIKYYE